MDDPKLRQQVVNLEELENVKIEANDVFSSLGAHPAEGGWEAFTKAEFDYPRRLAEHAARSGARQFIFVSVVDSKHSANYRNYTRLKRQLEAIAGGLGFAAVHVLRSSLLLGRRDKPRVDEQRLQRLMRLSKWMMVGPLRRYRTIGAREVGFAMVAAALGGGRGVQIYYHDQITALAASLVDDVGQ